MAKFTDYTQKTKPADADLLLIHDNAGAANKKTPFSGVWSWILDKLASAVISQLETTNKSIIPAINELNSKTYYAAYTRGKNIPENADLNDYLNTGVYYVRDSNIAATIKNYPPGVSSGGRLEVCELASGWKHQNFYPNDSADMYIRFANGRPWYKITAQQLQSE